MHEAAVGSGNHSPKQVKRVYKKLFQRFPHGHQATKDDWKEYGRLQGFPALLHEFQLGSAMYAPIAHDVECFMEWEYPYEH